MPLEPVARLLRESPDLAQVRQNLARVARLQAVFRRAVPEPLASSSRVTTLDGTTVVVAAANGSVAAALRAIAPRLVAALNTGRGGRNEPKSEKNQEVTAIRVEVQVAAGTTRPARSRPAPPTAETLTRLAEGLAPSPLREAIERMAAGQSSRKTRSTR